MPVVRATYRPDRKGIGAFLVSDQLREPVRDAARDVAALAAADGSQHIAADYAVQNGGTTVVAGNPRVTENVTNDNPAAAANEFGSGIQSEGTSAGQPRPQGGYSPAKRDLARAGQKIGDLRGEIG